MKSIKSRVDLKLPYIAILAGIFLAFLLGGCATPPMDVNAVLQLSAGEKLYTAYNIWHERDGISVVNYQVGSVIPFGSEVEIIEVRGNRIRFRVVETGREFTMLFHQKYWIRSIDDFLKKMVTREDFAAQAKGIPDEVLGKIRAGVVEPGMSKDQVIKAYGYPPPHRTPRLAENSWIYWRNRWITKRVFFKDDLVVELK